MDEPMIYGVNGFAAPKKPEIAKDTALKFINLAIADTIFHTILQKKGEPVWPTLPMITSKCRCVKIGYGVDMLKNW